MNTVRGIYLFFNIHLVNTMNSVIFGLINQCGRVYKKIFRAIIGRGTALLTPVMAFFVLHFFTVPSRECVNLGSGTLTPTIMATLSLTAPARTGITLADLIHTACQDHAASYAARQSKQAQENGGYLSFSSFVLYEGLRCCYDATVLVPMAREYQHDADDFYFIDAEDVLVIKCIVDEITIENGNN